MNNTRVSIETVIQGSREEPIDFKCRSEKQALKLRATLVAAPELLEALINLRDNFDYPPAAYEVILNAIAKAEGELK